MAQTRARLLGIAAVGIDIQFRARGHKLSIFLIDAYAQIHPIFSVV